MSLHVMRAMTSNINKGTSLSNKSRFKSKKMYSVTVSHSSFHSSVWYGKVGLINMGNAEPSSSNENNADHRTHIPRASYSKIHHK